MLSPLELLVGALAVYRLSYLFAKERGPLGIMHHLRNIGVPDCLYCLSIWFAVFVYVLQLFAPVLVFILALSGASLLLHRYTGGDHL